jgi:nuclear transport factor 2 (NTF2) superfamily protein
MNSRPPVPPFTEETARQKVRAAQDAWNTRDPERVVAAYTEDSRWRNRDEFFQGREAIADFLRRKWERELDYRLRKELWCFTGSRISVRFEYESRDSGGLVAQPWQRALGVRRAGPHAQARCEHQRLSHRGARATHRGLTADNFSADGDRPRALLR